jgi:membrane protein required for colicin V production
MQARLPGSAGFPLTHSGRSMSWVDYCIIAVLALSSLMGLMRGFIGEVVALACWVIAFWVAWMFGPQLAAAFTAIDTPSVRLLLGYSICFFAVLIAGAIFSFLMRKLIMGSGLSGSDRLLGMVFGLLRGLVLVTLLVLVLGFTPLAKDPWWQHSEMLPTFQRAAAWVSERLPPEVAKYLDLRQFLPQIESPVPAPPPKSQQPKPQQQEKKTPQ